MEANFKNQKAILQEYIDQFYVEHFEDMEDNTNRIAALQTIDESRNWIYKGKLGYVVDSDGYVHYFLIIENFPKEIRDQIKYGIGEKKYSDYVNCKDVWGITENLDVYYCKDGQNSMDGAVLGSLDQENGSDIVFKDGNPLAKKVKSEGGDVTKSDLRGITSFTLDQSTELTNLNDMYNFSNLTDLTIQDLNLTSLDGIEYLPRLKRLYIIRSTSGNYKSLGKISEQINYLFFQDTNNDEIEKFCSYDEGVGCNKDKCDGADFTNLAWFGIYGRLHYTIDYLYDEIRENSGDCYHSRFDNISYLSNLSKITKERISNLFLNNNSLNNIDNLWEFKNVGRLRIEGNYLKNLNGLYNADANPDGESREEKEQGMLKLKYLHAYSNLLGDDEGETLDIEEDGLSVLSVTSYDTVRDAYAFSARFGSLELLNVENNNIKFLNYISENNGLKSLYINNNANLDLELGVQSIMNILEKEGLTYLCDEYVSNYINENSKKVAKITISEPMTISEFRSFFDR